MNKSGSPSSKAARTTPMRSSVNVTSREQTCFDDVKEEADDQAQFDEDSGDEQAMLGLETNVAFEPSEFYMYEVLKFQFKHASLRDKVETIKQAKKFWEGDLFLTNCHGKSHKDDKSREGRKLQLAAYHKRMQYTPM